MLFNLFMSLTILFFFRSTILQAKRTNFRTCFKKEKGGQKHIHQDRQETNKRKHLYFDKMLFSKNSVDDRDTLNNSELPPSPETVNYESTSIGSENQRHLDAESSRRTPTVRQLTSNNYK